MSVIIEVPVKTYIGHYLLLHYRSDNFKDTVKFDKLTKTGRHFYRLLSDPVESNDRRINLDYFKMVIKIEITERVLMRRGYYMTRSNTVDFNAAVEEEIGDKAASFVAGYMLANKHATKKEAIESFLKKIRMNDEILPYDNIKKKVYRYELREKRRQEPENEQM